MKLKRRMKKLMLDDKTVCNYCGQRIINQYEVTDWNIKHELVWVGCIFCHAKKHKYDVSMIDKKDVYPYRRRYK